MDNARYLEVKLALRASNHMEHDCRMELIRESDAHQSVIPSGIILFDN